MNRARLEQLARTWRRRTISRDLLFALAAALLAAAGSRWSPEPWRWLAPVAGFVGTLLIRLATSRPWTLDAAQIARHLNRTHPELEESAALFLRPAGDLTLLEKLQLGRVSRRVSERSENQQPSCPGLGDPPRAFLRLAWWWLAAGAALIMVLALQPARRSPATAPISSPARQAVNTPTAVPLLKVLGNIFTITPPGYTGHVARRVEGFTAEAEEGATVAWSIEIDGAPRDARLVAGSVKIPLTTDGNHRVSGAVNVAESTLFALTGTLADGTAWNPAELFSIKVVKDQPPVVRIVQPAQTRTEIVPPAAPVAVETIVSDDYGVADAHIVATVAKGSGESVKFREQAIPFDTDAPAETPQARRFTKALDLAALGLEPGDELYFFVEAHDSRQPVANHTRSEMRFLRLRGPEERPTTTGRGIAGINLVPQYFRSERQLIIDTEKLVAEQASLPDEKFRERGNDLGADQALLRLRYGRFLGEDQEESALTDHLETPLDPLQAAPPAAAPGPHAAASIAQRFQQEHTEQDREGGEGAAPRPLGGNAPLSAEQVRQPFVDSHDLHDKNTFFDNETKGTMRDALAAMWEAEGFLRTARPAEALAPEHRALDILKDLQQSARAYVQHVGFEAPPLKVAERQLKGDVTDVPALGTVTNPVAVGDPAAMAIRRALAEFARSGTIPSAAMDDVQTPFAAAAARQPEEFLTGMQTLRKMRAGQAISEEEAATVQRALLRLLPPANPLPTRPAESAPGLAARYYQSVQSTEGKP